MSDYKTEVYIWLGKHVFVNLRMNLGNINVGDRVVDFGVALAKIGLI